MTLILRNGRKVSRCEDGYLSEEEGYEGWSNEFADAVAKEENVEMSDAHREVVDFLRGYYEEYRIAPMIRILTRAISKRLGQKENTKCLYDLYPGGGPQACKIAGLPKSTVSG